MGHMLDGRSAEKPESWREVGFLPNPSAASQYGTVNPMTKPAEACEPGRMARAWEFHSIVRHRHKMNLLSTPKGLAVRDEFDQMVAGVPCWVLIMSDAPSLFTEQVRRNCH